MTSRFARLTIMMQRKSVRSALPQGSSSLLRQLGLFVVRAKNSHCKGFACLIYAPLVSKFRLYLCHCFFSAPPPNQPTKIVPILREMQWVTQWPMSISSDQTQSTVRRCSLSIYEGHLTHFSNENLYFSLGRILLLQGVSDIMNFKLKSDDDFNFKVHY